MVRPSLKEDLRQAKIGLKEWFFWLSVRETPKSWFAGGYSRIKWMRFTLGIVSLLCYSALALGYNFTLANYFDIWVGLAGAGYIIIALIYILGLRMWYAPSVLFFLVSAIINIMINVHGGPLGVGAATPDFLATSVIMWLYVVIVGTIAMPYDKGSKINDALMQS